MSQPIESPQLDVDGGRWPWRSVVAALVLGLLIGALLGGLYGASRPPSYRATTALSVLPDTLVNTVQNPPAVDATSFIQSQLVILNGGQLSSQVQQQLKLAVSPNVSSTQVGQSYAVQVTATADSRERALAIATATGNLYAKQRGQQLTAEINASVKSVESQLLAVRSSLALEQLSPTLTPSQTALQTEYERLLSVDSALKLALPQVNRVVTVLSPASIASGSLSRTAKGLIGGGVLGGLAGLALLILTHRLVSRVRTVADLAGLGVTVLLPVLPRVSIRARRGPAAWRSPAGRLLAARLTGSADGVQQPIVVVGATPGVGTSFVAATLASGLAERDPVLLVLASEMVGGSNRRQLQPVTSQSSNGSGRPQVAGVSDQAVPSVVDGVWLLTADFGGFDGASASSRGALLGDIARRASDAGWLVVIDAPALSDSNLVLSAAAQAVTVLVVGRSLSRPAEIFSAAELFQAQGVPFAGAILNDVPNSLLARHVRYGRAATVSQAGLHSQTGSRRSQAESASSATAPRPTGVSPPQSSLKSLFSSPQAEDSRSGAAAMPPEPGARK